MTRTKGREGRAEWKWEGQGERWRRLGAKQMRARREVGARRDCWRESRSSTLAFWTSDGARPPRNSRNLRGEQWGGRWGWIKGGRRGRLRSGWVPVVGETGFRERAWESLRPGASDPDSDSGSCTGLPTSESDVRKEVAWEEMIIGRGEQRRSWLVCISRSLARKPRELWRRSQRGESRSDTCEAPSHTPLSGHRFLPLPHRNWAAASLITCRIVTTWSDILPPWMGIGRGREGECERAGESESWTWRG
jgi:hypothetical protein